MYRRDAARRRPFAAARRAARAISRYTQAMILRQDTLARLCRARDLLRETPERARSIAEIAREVRISPFHFIRQFEAAFGVTPHQFRIRHRLDRACRLLGEDGPSVTEVCFEVGFSSLGSFSDLFSRRVGAAPSAYRRRRRAMIQVPGPIAIVPGCLGMLTALPPDALRNFREA